MSHFILIHGMKDDSKGADNIDRIADPLRALGHTVETDEADYGKYSIWKVRFRRHEVINRIVWAIRRAVYSDKDLVVVGYSNGCSYGLKALKLVFVGQVKFVAIHPALPTKFKRPPSVAKAWVFYTKSDWATRLSTWFSWLVPGWGRAGTVGYKGDDPLIVNMNYTDIAIRHGGAWRDGTIDTTVDDLHYIAQEKL